MNPRQIARAAAALALSLGTIGSPAQTAYRYRDANGQWVFTDRAPASDAPTETFKVTHEKASPRMSVTRSDDPEGMQLIATNECLCTVTVMVSVVRSDFPTVPTGDNFLTTLGPSTTRPLVQVKMANSAAIPLEFKWHIALGSPTAVHAPPRPYRAPFAMGTSYPVSQAFPSRFTHVTPESQYAVDMVLPDGTPIYAAREGMVINTRHDSFRGGAAAVMLDQANVVEILHDDGTIAIYGHLHWDSIRVRIGETVARGQYIADSGNTGFSTGPHLHFAVIRNAGTEDVSIPVQFTGFGGTAVSPVTNQSIAAY